MNICYYTISIDVEYLKIIFSRSRGLIIFYVFFSIFKKVKFNIYVYIYIIFAEKLLSFVICSCEIESFEIISPNISSTLNAVEFTISFRLST